MTNHEIANVFRRLADLMELGEENPFKIRSYRTAAETIEDWPQPLAEIVANGGPEALRELPGVGQAISKKIVDLLSTGTFNAYEKAKAKIPETVLDILKVDGIGIKTLQLLHQQFQLTNLDDFAKFVAGGGLDSVSHMGEKTQVRICESLKELGY